MSLATGRLRFRFSYVIVFVTFLALVVSFAFSRWWKSREYEAKLPRDASESVVRGLIAYHGATGSFPKTLVEVERKVWKHEKEPNFGESGRTLLAYNYNYVYFQVDEHECAFYVIPGGERREEAPSFYYYLSARADKLWKWKGPPLSEEDIVKLEPVRPGSKQAMLLGVLGMSEQPKGLIKIDEGVKSTSLLNAKQ